MNLIDPFAEIDCLKSRLGTLCPLPEYTVRTLHEQQILGWIYHSNAIEGNTLTEKETNVVLEGVTIGGKPLREHFEVINYKKAINYVEALVHAKALLSELHIKSIHHFILKNIDDRNAGQYRHENIVVAGAEHVPPHFLNVPEAMASLIEKYGAEEHLHPVECAARLHADFIGIHPFVDGNGHTARLLMNFELIRRGFLPAIIPVWQRLEYYDALDTAHTCGEYTLFIELVAGLEQTALARYLRIIQGSPN
ncbi:Fic family protein [Methylovulum psychrotolerans]|uniref:Fic family protein n=1 Tax=Methylovulum psychrotolerans TaxID=1704499 RepID=A0A2S5CGF7_9GAMM|nr:Fic family protein [Methylovulum psychrotolerans]POZ49847.1 Fic family protein [Methylovulum psychrotolerans]